MGYIVDCKRILIVVTFWKIFKGLCLNFHIQSFFQIAFLFRPFVSRHKLDFASHRLEFRIECPFPNEVPVKLLHFDNRIKFFHQLLKMASALSRVSSFYKCCQVFENLLSLALFLWFEYIFVDSDKNHELFIFFFTPLALDNRILLGTLSPYNLLGAILFCGLFKLGFNLDLYFVLRTMYRHIDKFYKLNNFFLLELSDFQYQFNWL